MTKIYPGGGEVECYKKADIVDVLRDEVEQLYVPLTLGQILADAAKEIESLRAELEVVKFRLEQYELSDIGEMERQLEERRIACNQVMKERDELATICRMVVENGIGFSDVKAMNAALAKLGADKTGEVG